ncbi:hypothetical protein [Qipengyuania marisflavi]|uniref:DUF4410 domain-containing protein n=1 Tax=Qipengyuania marisflavi TaxID=2486356 RepID=A0A5S3P9X8_9SPHN|nr:hypothetical protein [Qipengyuania marisflavi]TMM50276.1 hypothetical protein FEV51_03595 [Qipengyuania marisflavi]
MMTKLIQKLMMVLALVGLALQPAAAAAKSKDPIKVSNAKAAAGTQQVAIGQFTLAVLVERKDNAKAGGGLLGGGFGGKSTVRSRLEGVTPEQMQAVADAAYEDFAAKLTAQGFTLIDHAALAAYVAPLKAAEQFAEKTIVVGKDDKAKALMVGATQTGPLRLMDGDYNMAGIGDMGTRQTAWKTQGAMQQYAKDTGVRVINVVYVMNFAASDEYGGWHRSTSSVKVASSLGLAPEATKVTLVGPGTPAQLVLKQPIGVGGDYFAKADAMGGGEKAVRAVTKVLSILGGGGSNSVKKFTFTALPGAYPDAAIQAAATANTGMAERLASLR